ncbi:MAG: branched-chain amino acid ABC transporter permease [Deltaproteobacteria bacterium]|nr:branched-chain amino acid ABC transporter permease [Deltaproteobacteria bacterium]MBI3075590.1 branched-chain amino acid ABC transporter permease [Deltaproteobacteria bacterium]
MFALLLQVIANGLLIGSIYGLAALGLTLVWGIMDVVNLAHGEFILVGAYLCYWLFAGWGISPLVSFALSIPLGVLFGWLVHVVLIRQVVGKPALTTLLLTFGLSILLNNLMLNIFTPDVRMIRWSQQSILVGPLVLPSTRLIAFGIVLLLTAALYLFLERTYPGRGIRALMQDAEAAAALGVNTARILLLSFVIGTIFAVVAGALVSVVLPFEPASALPLAIVAFVVVVVGGLGRPLGAMLGGILVGTVESFTGTFISQAYAPATVSFLLILFLLVRPAGLFGTTVR